MASKKQRRIVADQIARGLNYFEELNLTVVVLIEGIPKMYGSSSSLLKAAIVEQQFLLNTKIAELRTEQAADKIVAIPTSDGDEPMAH
jgi:hypothetical protein